MWWGKAGTAKLGRLGRKKLIMLTSSRGGGSLNTIQGYGGSSRSCSGGRRQERGESMGQNFYWDFLGRSRAGQTEWQVWIIPVGFSLKEEFLVAWYLALR